MKKLIRPLAVTAALGCAGVVGLRTVHADSPPKPADQPASAAPIKFTNAVVKTKFAVEPKPLSDGVKKGIDYLLKSQQEDGGWAQGGGWRTAVNGQGGRIEGGLIAALRNLIREHAKDGLKVAFLLRGYEAQNAGLEHALFRVAQEALGNVAKHARVEEATLMLAQEGTRIELRVVDDGAGFDLPVRGGLGLPGMRERIEAAGGRFRVSSRAGAGTILQAIVYLPENPRP